MTLVSDEVDSRQADSIVKNIETEARFAFIKMIRLYLSTKDEINYATVLQAFVVYVEERQQQCLEWLEEDSEIEVTAEYWAKLKAGSVQPSLEQCKLLLTSFHNALCRPGDKIKSLKLSIPHPHLKVMYWKVDRKTERVGLVNNLELSKGEKDKLAQLGLSEVSSFIVFESGIKHWSQETLRKINGDRDLLEAIYLSLKAAGYKPVYVLNDND